MMTYRKELWKYKIYDTDIPELSEGGKEAYKKREQKYGFK